MATAALEETKLYLESVIALLSSEEDDPVLITSRAYEEIKGQESALAQDKTGSQALEKMFQKSALKSLLEFLDHMPQENYSAVALNPFGSHVLESYLATLQQLLSKATKGEEKLASEAVAKFLKAIEPATEEWLQDPHGTYVLRAIFRFLSGSPASAPKPNTETDQHSKKYTVPSGLKGELQRIAEHLQKQLSPPEIYYYTCHQAAGPTLQALILALRNQPTVLDKLLKAIIDPSAPADSAMHDHMKELLEHSIGSHFLEPLLEVASNDLFSEIYTRYFRKHLVEMCRHHISNFVVQRLIANARDTPQVEMIFQELQPHLGEILSLGRAGVLLQLVEVAPRRLQSPHHVIKAVLNAVTSSAREPSSLIHSLLRLQISKPNAKRRGEKYSSLGIRIAQVLLKIPSENKQLLESFMELDVKEVLDLAQDPSGSRLLEAISEAATLGQKKKLVEKLKTHFAMLAAHKFASHVLESLYKHCEISQKQMIVGELAAAREHLAANYFGRMVLRNCRVEQYEKKQDQWQSKQLSDEKKRKLFAEFLDEIDDGAAPDSHALKANESDHEDGTKPLTSEPESETPKAKKAKSEPKHEVKPSELERETQMKKEKKHKKRKSEGK